MDRPVVGPSIALAGPERGHVRLPARYARVRVRRLPYLRDLSCLADTPGVGARTYAYKRAEVRDRAMQMSRRYWFRDLFATAAHWGIPAELALALSYRESRMLIAASSGPARGLLQVTYVCAVHHGERFDAMYDPGKNIAVGMAYLAFCAYRNGDWASGLAGYGWGAATARRSLWTPRMRVSVTRALNLTMMLKPVVSALRRLRTMED